MAFLGTSCRNSSLEISMLGDHRMTQHSGTVLAQDRGPQNPSLYHAGPALLLPFFCLCSFFFLKKLLLSMSHFLQLSFALFLIHGLISTRFIEISIPFDKSHRSQCTLSKSSIPTPTFEELEPMIPMGPFQLGIFHDSTIPASLRALLAYLSPPSHQVQLR